MRRWILVAIVVALAATIAAVGVVLRNDSESPSEEAFTVSSIAPPVPTTIGTTVEPLEAAGRTPTPEPEAEYGPRTPLDHGEDTLDPSLIPATAIQPTTDPRATPDAFVLASASLIGENGSTPRADFIAEPTVAANGDRLFVTWNWGAAVSGDGGKTFRYMNPYGAFDAPRAGTVFCCDQIATYIPSADLWVWLLQYDSNESGNVLRIATARGDADFDATAFSARSFLVSPQDLAALKAPRDAWFDYSGMSFTSRFLYVADNVFQDADPSRMDTVVMRFPIEQLASGAKPTPDAVVLSSPGTVRLAAGVTDTMYFAQHLGTSRLNVWKWTDDASAPDGPSVVTHLGAPLDDLSAYSCPRTGAIRGDWCERETDGAPNADDRPTSAWLSGGTLGFAWNAPASKLKGFPYPYVAVVLINPATMETKEASAIWSADYAYQYPAFVPNGRGDVAGVALAGGGSRYMTCVALLRAADGSGWEARVLDESDGDVTDNAAGDYLAATPSSGGSNQWTASCMTVHGGSSAANVGVRVFKFGRARDTS